MDLPFSGPCYYAQLHSESLMDEDRFNMALRKFLKEVGVTSQREIERIVRDNIVSGSMLRLRMTLTSEDSPDFKHVVETKIPLL